MRSILKDIVWTCRFKGTVSVTTPLEPVEIADSLNAQSFEFCRCTHDMQGFPRQSFSTKLVGAVPRWKAVHTSQPMPREMTPGGGGVAPEILAHA
jgi:hypothetical protein